MRKTIVIGIDPGIHGAISFWDDGRLLKAYAFPHIGASVDYQMISSDLETHKNRIKQAYLEQSQMRRELGAKQTHMSGKNSGIIEGILIALKIPYFILPVQTWQKDLHQGTGVSKKPKERSLLAASRLFPGVNLKKSDRATKPHDGIVDALLIGYYGVMKQ